MQKNFSIILSAGRSCFVKCLGCYNFFGKNEELTGTHVILDFLSQAYSQGIKKITVGGGDPLSRPDIIPLLQNIKDIGFRINLDTVGTPLLGETETFFYGRHHIPMVSPESLVSSVDLIGIPVDGTDSREIATFRTGRASIFDEQIRILETLDKYDANICVNTVIHQGNHSTAHEILDAISSFASVKKWQCFQFMPIGPLGFRNREQYEISDSVFEETKERIARYSEQSSSSCEIEFKSRTARKGNYLLIDTDGVAWVPKTTFTAEWNAVADPSKERIIAGNINNRDDHTRLIQAVLEPQKILIDRNISLSTDHPKRSFGA